MMLPDRTDTERRLSVEERIETAKSQFERGAMTEAVFRATLFGAGMRGQAIETEVRLLHPTDSLASATKRALDGFVSGLQ